VRTVKLWLKNGETMVDHSTIASQPVNHGSTF